MASSGSKGGGIAFAVIGVVVLAVGIGGWYVYKNGLPNIPKIGGPQVGNWQNKDVYKVPYLFWGGDVAAFHANGGIKTKPDSTFGKAGLKLEFTDGNDFEAQVKDYLAGDTPFLRGTFSQLGQKCDVLGADPRTRPVIILQLTWSAGDHLVSREGLKTLGDLKNKTVALQEAGPHVGMLDDVLRTAQLKWSDIHVKWTKEVDGDNGPAALFRKDPTVDACFAITPEMTDLTGGLESTGDGTKDSVKGAHVLVSTADMKRSIADVYAVRKDFFDANKDLVEKFAAGFLKGCEEVVALRKEHGAPGGSPRYREVLTLAQEIFGKDKLKTQDDAEGLIGDAVFVGLPGNKSFFTDRGNLSGFEAKQRAALDLAVDQGYAKQKIDFHKPDFDYDKLKKLGGLTGQAPPEDRFARNVKFSNENTLYFFTISFDPNEDEFSEAKYGEDFRRALEQASLFGNSVMAVRGHADPSKLVQDFLTVAQDRGVISQKGGAWVLKDGTKVDLTNIHQIADLVDTYNLVGSEKNNPKEIVPGLLDLSNRRANKVRDAVLKYAESRNIRIDKSQIKPVGAGGFEPIVAQVRKDEDATKNRRVEFRLIRVVGAEARTASDFDY